MHYSIILALATLASATPLARRKDDRFKPGTVWDIVLQGKDDNGQGSVIPLAQLKAAAGTVLDIDLEDNDSLQKNTKGWIKDLSTKKTVVCYFSAGTYEPWREDKALFLPSDRGKKMEDWDEWWLDLKSSNVKKIMESRIKRAAEAGCHAIDPDNIDGYVSATISPSRQLRSANPSRAMTVKENHTKTASTTKTRCTSTMSGGSPQPRPSTT